MGASRTGKVGYARAQNCAGSRAGWTPGVSGSLLGGGTCTGSGGYGEGRGPSRLSVYPKSSLDSTNSLDPSDYSASLGLPPQCAG